jgi:carotenoid cleavage dioxygenase-like enzyme
VTDTMQTPFLEGLMAPVSEERGDLDLTVIGEIPDGLNGMFVRNGPNPQFAPLGSYHPFDGDAMVHAVYIEDGAARYKNRWIESAGLLAERKRGRACYGGLSNFVIPDEDVLAEGGMLKNTANTHFIRHAGRYFGLLEAGKPTEVTRELETLGEHDFDGRLEGPMTAHPKVDPTTGNLCFFGYSAVQPYLRYHEADADGNLVHSVDLDLPAPIMMHDFAVTEHFAVFFDSPAVFNLEAMLNGEPPLSWKAENGTRIGVLPRGGEAGDIRWFDTGNAYVVHFFNAWENGDEVEIRAPRMEDMPGGFEFDDPGAAREPMPWRWTVDLNTGLAADSQTDDRPGEFPRINDGVACRQSRYLYNSTARSWEFSFDFDGVIKYDLETGASQQRRYADSQVSGEHVFAPRPGGTAEDDGWLLTMVTDRVSNNSELVILDATDIEAEPVARLQTRARVPLGFHANWFPDS